MRLLIIRHGESEGDILNRLEGRADFNLTELGNRQAQLMADWIAEKYKVDKIMSSPLKRASQVAKILSERVDVDVLFDDELMEWNNGLLAGLTKDEARIKYPVPEVKYPHTCVYEQESSIQLRMRAETVLSRLLNDNPKDSTIAVVSHGLFIQNLFHSFLRLPVTSNNIWFPTGDTGIHEWSVDENSRGIIHVNQQRHLENL